MTGGRRQEREVQSGSSSHRPAGGADDTRAEESDEPSSEPEEPRRSGRLLQSGLVLGAGALLATPYWVEPLGPLVVLGVVLWALAVDPRIHAKGTLAGYLGIFLFVTGGLLWLWGFQPAAPFLLGAYFGLYGIVASWAYRGGVRAGLPAWAVLPFAWTGVELLLREASLFPTGWLHLGYALLPLGPPVQTADLWGVSGLSFLAVLAAGVGTELAIPYLPNADRARSRGRIAGLSVVAILLLASTLYGIWRVENLELREEVELLLVQGNIPQSLKQKPQNEGMIFLRHVELTTSHADEGLDLVVWPETSASVFPDPSRRGLWKESIARLTDQLGVPMLVGAADRAEAAEETRGTNSAFLFHPGGAEPARYDKLVLVPFGEYIPVVEHLPDRLNRRVREFFQATFGVYPHMLPGPGPRALEVVHGGRSFRVAALVCYEDVMPGLTASFVRAGADLLTNPSNEAWYWHREMDQHLTIARMRAIENRRPVARATNTGLTAVIDPRGHVTDRLVVEGKDRDVAGALRTSVPLCSTDTLYTRFGPWFARGCAVVLGFLLLILAPVMKLKDLVYSRRNRPLVPAGPTELEDHETRERAADARPGF